jgi:hypothetical protein
MDICDLYNETVCMKYKVDLAISSTNTSADAHRYLLEIQQKLDEFKTMILFVQNRPETWWRFLHDLQWGAIENALLALQEDTKEYALIHELDMNLEGIRLFLEEPKIIESLKNDRALLLPSL